MTNSLGITKFPFKEEDVIKIIESKSEESKTGNYFLYFHYPFCINTCNFCIYTDCNYINDFGKDITNKYFEALVNQIKRLTPSLEKMNFRGIAFGGGTPSLMTPEMFRTLRRIVPNWDSIPEKVLEAHPVDLNESKCKVLKEVGITYISIGIQTFDKEVLKFQNRLIQDENKLLTAVNNLKDMGIHVNFDIMTGLELPIGKDINRYDKDIGKALNIYKVDSVDVYPELNYTNKLTLDEYNTFLRETYKKTLKYLFNNQQYLISGIENNYSETMKKLANNDVREFKPKLLLYRENQTRPLKRYSASNPPHHQYNQGLISLGGFEEIPTYSYGENNSFLFYHGFDLEFNSIYERGEIDEKSE